MDDEIGFECELPGITRSFQPQGIARTFNGLRTKIDLKIDFLFAQARHNHRHEIGIKPFERTQSTMNDGDLRARNCGAWANSIEMYPPPIKMMRGGSVSSSRN